MDPRPKNTLDPAAPVREHIPFAQELLRKGTHLGALIIPASYFYFGLTKLQMLSIMVPAFLLMLLIDIARLRGWGLWNSYLRPVIGGMVRDREADGDFIGATYILLSICLTVAIFSQPIAVAALSFIIVGDTFAALVGRKFGTHFYGRKTLEGSLACLAGTVLVALLTPNLPITIGLAGAVVAAVVEARSFKVDDNVSVPLISGLVMTLLTKIFTNS